MNILNLISQKKLSAEGASLQDFELLQDKIAVVVIRLLFGFIVIPMLWNYINGFYVRSFIQLLAVVAFAICIFLANKNIYRDARDWIMIAGMYNITITSLVTNGGFAAPAGMIAVAGFVGVSMTCTGLRRTNEILFVALVSVVIVLLLQVYGYIPAYDNTSFAGGWIFMLSFLLSMFLLGQSHSTQQHSLTQAAIARESALRTAQSAQQAESRLLSNMSHEIRNPLSGVLGLIQLSLEESDPAKIKKNLETASLAGEHLHNIVDDILTLKKIEELGVQDHKTPVDLVEFFQHWNKLFSSLAKRGEITYQSPNLTDCPRYVIADKQLLGQIFSNVVSNAIKFTPKSGLVIADIKFDTTASELTLIVKDSGIGMNEATLKTLFKRFNQAEDSSEKVFAGTGLGLAISNELVTSLGGHISVVSELGEGSTFTVVLPLQIDKEREDAWRSGIPADDLIPVRKPIADLSAVRALCVDDSEINLVVIAGILNKANAHVTTALSAPEAYELLTKGDFTIVLTDISMPEMDGEKLQSMIKAYNPKLPVIAVTGNVLEDDKRRFLANGFVGVVDKPFDSDELRNLVLEHHAPSTTD